MAGLALPARPRPPVPLPRSTGEPPPAAPRKPDRPAADLPRRLAEAQVSERDGTVVIEFWVDVARGPVQLRRLLVAETFGHPAVRARRPVLVSVPLGDSALLGEVGARLAMARTRACGSTCLIEGVVRG